MDLDVSVSLDGLIILKRERKGQQEGQNKRILLTFAHSHYPLARNCRSFCDKQNRRLST